LIINQKNISVFNPKVSIVMSVLNAEKTIANALESFKIQTYCNKELIIIDGKSTDETLAILSQYDSLINKLISEEDDGLYFALNKGFDIATGSLIGILHADDFFADKDVIEDIVEIYRNNPNVSAIFADLDYVSKDNINLRKRKWKSSVFSKNLLMFGWMPPHPTLFVSKKIHDDIGPYNTSYKISSDYDYIWRLFSIKNAIYKYLPRVTVKMRVGGKSNVSLKNIFQKSSEDFNIIKSKKKSYVVSFFILIFKNLRKIIQLFT